MEWKNEKKFADHRPGLEVVVGVDLDGDIGILAQDGRRTGQYFSVIIAGRESLALAEHINQMYGYSGPDVDDRIATLTAERDAERASAMAFHVELQRLRMWCGEFVSRIEQRGVVGISDDADLVDIFREAALAQLKEQDDER